MNVHKGMFDKIWRAQDFYKDDRVSYKVLDRNINPKTFDKS